MLSPIPGSTEMIGAHHDPGETGQHRAEANTIMNRRLMFMPSAETIRRRWLRPYQHADPRKRHQPAKPGRDHKAAGDDDQTPDRVKAARLR